MSDNLRRYRVIQGALTQGYPGEPPGQVVRHLTTLAALISGIVASQSAQLPNIATPVPDGTKPESRVKRFARWVRNDTITEEAYFLNDPPIGQGALWSRFSRSANNAGRFLRDRAWRLIVPRARAAGWLCGTPASL